MGLGDDGERRPGRPAQPALGAIVDAGGRRKPWLLGATVIGALATAGLWWAEPAAAAIPLMLLLVLVASTALEVGQTFYNAMLADLAPRSGSGAGRAGAGGWAMPAGSWCWCWPVCS